MLGIRKTVVSYDEKDLMELERIIIGDDENDALAIYWRKLYLGSFHDHSSI